MRRATRARALYAALCAALCGAAQAAGTPANTTITNTATLTYNDALNTPRTLNSNPSTVTVRQVYVISVEPSASESAIPLNRQFTAAPGTLTRIPYQVTNSGNGSDTLTLGVLQSGSDTFDVTTRLLPDPNCDGVADGAPIDGIPQTLAADATICVLVEASVPAATPAASVARLTLTGASQGDPAVTDLQNYAQVTASATGSINLSKSVTPTPVQPGGTLTYTVSGTVQNAAAGAVTNVVTVDGTPRTGVLVRDALPAISFDAVTAAAASAGTARALYSTDGGTTWTFTAPASGVTAVGLLVEGTGAFLPVGSTLTLTFTATVPATAAAGTQIRNAATSLTDGNGDGDSDDPGETTTTTDATTTVATVTAVSVGPNGFPQGGASGSYTLQGQTITRAGDTQTMSSPVTAGTTTTFRHTTQNTGNATETITLAVPTAPSGWTCTVRSIDGSDTLGTLTNPVTLTPGQSLDFAVSCAVPSSAAGTTNATLTVSATPQGGAADTTTDTAAQIVAAGAPILGNGDLNPATAPDPTPVTVAANPGATATFPLELRNGGVLPEAYTLTSTATGTQFYLDTNCDGVPDGAATGTTPSVAPGTTLCLIAQVPVAPGTAAGPTPVTFTATSTTDPARTSTLTDTVRVNAVASGTFAPDGAQSTIPGGQVTYSHTLTNTGNSAATYAVGPYTGTQGFTYAFATTPTGPFTPILSGTLPAGGSTPVYVQVTVPAGTGAPSSETAALTATLTAQDAPQPSATAQVTDTTGVQTVQASVAKTVQRCTDLTCTSTSAISGNLVSPGNILQYTLIARNDGSSVLYGATLFDAVPASTTFRVLSATPGVLFSADGGASWSATPPAALPTGQFLAGLDTDSSGRIDNADVLNPGVSFQVTFTVQVN